MVSVVFAVSATFCCAPFAKSIVFDAPLLPASYSALRPSTFTAVMLLLPALIAPVNVPPAFGSALSAVVPCVDVANAVDALVAAVPSPRFVRAPAASVAPVPPDAIGTVPLMAAIAIFHDAFVPLPVTLVTCIVIDGCA